MAPQKKTWLRAILGKHWIVRVGGDANTNTTNIWLRADALSMERTAWATLAHEGGIAEGRISMTTDPLSKTRHGGVCVYDVFAFMC